MRYIKIHEPDFFSRFETEIKSGDHTRVQAALQQAGVLTKAYVEGEYGKPDRITTQACGPTVCVLAVYAGVVITVAGAITNTFVVAGLLLFALAAPDSAIAPDSATAADMVIDEVTNAFASK